MSDTCQFCKALLSDADIESKRSNLMICNECNTAILEQLPKNAKGNTPKSATSSTPKVCDNCGTEQTTLESNQFRRVLCEYCVEHSDRTRKQWDWMGEFHKKVFGR